MFFQPADRSAKKSGQSSPGLAATGGGRQFFTIVWQNFPREPAGLRRCNRRGGLPQIRRRRGTTKPQIPPALSCPPDKITSGYRRHASGFRGLAKFRRECDSASMHPENTQRAIRLVTKGDIDSARTQSFWDGSTAVRRRPALFLNALFFRERERHEEIDCGSNSVQA